MKAGERFCCPHCGAESLVRRKALTEGFRKTGEVLVCAFCDAVVGAPEPESAAGAAAEAGERGRKLAALLGGDERERVSLGADPESRFCRDCRHFIAHPFRSRCGLTGETADPMADCADFAAREPGRGEK